MNETIFSVSAQRAGGPMGTLSLLMPPAFVDCLPIAIYACDAEGHVLWCNRRATQLWGRRPFMGVGGERFCGSLRLFLEGQELPHENCPMVEALVTGNPIEGVEVEIERPDGSRIWAMVHIEPIKDEAGAVIGAINCFHETTESRRANKQLRRQQQDLEDFFQNGAIALHLVASDGTILKANQAELDLLGYTVDEYVGRQITEFHADRPVIEDILTRLSRGERLDKYPARLIAKDGSIRHVLITSNVQFREGEFLNTRCFTLDVSDWSFAQEKLREQDQRLAATYENADIGISEADVDGRLLRVNEPLCAITGYSRQELLLRTFFDLTHPDDREPDRTLYRRQAVGELPHYALEKRYIRKDGTVVWVKVNASAVRDRNGQFSYGVRVVQDITERKQAEELLRESESRFREMIQALPAAIYTTDAAGRITFYNQAAVELSGREPKIGSDEWCVTWRLYRPDGTSLPHDQCPMAVALNEGRPIRGTEAIAERPDGTRIPFIPYPTPLRDASGALVGAINMLVDISERKQAEANQQILLNELNHRVKNNMQMLHSLLKAAQRETPNNDARIILADASRRIAAMGLAQQVLYDTQNPSHFRATELIKAVCEGVRQAINSNIRIVCDPSYGTLSNNNAMPLALILNELLTNAVKHGCCNSSGEIRASLINQDQEFLLSVEDNGPGFDLKQVRTRASGLGLVIGLARQLGGELQVSEGQGARCTVRFKEQWSAEP